MNYHRGKLGIVSCNSGSHFAEKVLGELKEIIKKEKSHNDVRIINTSEVQFSNTEFKTEIDESIRNKDMYIIQDVENNQEGLSVNDNFAVLKTAIQAVKMSDAHYITAVLPVYPYARQDKPRKREGITAATIARELEDLGVTRVITLDIHNEAIAGFFRKATLEILRASKDIMEYVKENIGAEELVIVAPDAGGVERANFYAKKLGTKLALIYKKRDYSKTSTIEEMTLLGDVEGKKVFVVDDIIDTAGTLVNAAKKLKERGAEEVYFAASLPLFNGSAVDRINKACEEGYITKIIGTDVVFHGEKFVEEHEWYEEVSMAKYFARVIYNINKGLSISRLLE